jgi:hypothetical protein
VLQATSDDLQEVLNDALSAAMQPGIPQQDANRRVLALRTMMTHVDLHGLGQIPQCTSTTIKLLGHTVTVCIVPGSVHVFGAFPSATLCLLRLLIGKTGCLLVERWSSGSSNLDDDGGGEAKDVSCEVVWQAKDEQEPLFEQFLRYVASL